MLICNSGRNPVSYGQPFDLVRASSRGSKLAFTDQIFPGIAFFLVFRKHVWYIECLRA